MNFVAWVCEFSFGSPAVMADTLVDVECLRLRLDSSHFFWTRLKPCASFLFGSKDQQTFLYICSNPTFFGQRFAGLSFQRPSEMPGSGLLSRFFCRWVEEIPLPFGVF